MKILFSSDWHADAFTAGFERVHDVEDSLQEILKEISSRRVNHFVFGGDLCNPESPRWWKYVSIVIDFLGELKRRGVTSSWMVGNHDTTKTNEETVLDWLQPFSTYFDFSTEVVRDPILKVIRKTYISPLESDASEDTDETVSIGFLPYPRWVNPYDPVSVVNSMAVAHAKEEKHPLIICSHLQIAGMHPGSESKEFSRGKDYSLPTATIREKFPNAPIIQAHYHKQDIVERDGKQIFIIGALAKLTFGEEQNKPGFIVVDTATL